MKTLILNGSPRKNGVTSQILSRIENLLDNLTTVEHLSVYDMDIKPCIGCLKCRPDKTCVLKEDDAHRTVNKIDDADLFIVGSPTYWGNMSGPLKTLFDRAVPTFEYIDGLNIKPVQKGKKAIIVTASSAPYPFNLLGSQSRGTVKSIKTILKSGGYKIIKTINIPNSNNFDKKKDKIFSDIKHFIERKKNKLL